MTIKRSRRTHQQVWAALAKLWLAEALKWAEAEHFNLFDYAMMKFNRCRDLSEVAC